MSDESDDHKERDNSTLEELKELIDEMRDEIKSSHRKELFSMAELLHSLDIGVEACQIKLSSGKNEYAIVIPISQFKKFRKLILERL